MNICSIEWQQCVGRRVDYIVLCQLSENLRFLNSSLTISNINGSG